MNKKHIIVEKGISLSEQIGYNKINFTNVSNIIGVQRTALYYYFPNAGALQNEIVRTAVKQNNYKIILQAIALNHPEAKNAI